MYCVEIICLMLSLLFQLVTLKGVGQIFVLLAPKTAYGTEDMLINICWTRTGLFLPGISPGLEHYPNTVVMSLSSKKQFCSAVNSQSF